MSNKKIITQHRRGTKAEWEAYTDVPKDGEIIIEKDTVPKIKVGNGKSEYSALPYITDELEASIIEQKTRIDNIAGEGNPLEGSWEKEVQDIRTIGDKTYTCAGDAVRGIYNDVKDFIGESAVNGLEYNQEGDYMLYLTSNGTRVGNGVEVKGGAGDNPSGNRLVIRFQEGTTSEIVVLETADSAYLEFIFEGYDTAGDPIASIDGEWKVEKNTVAYQTIRFGYNKFDIKPFIETTTQEVELVVTDTLGKSANKIWNKVQQIDLSITASMDDTIKYPANKDLQFDYVPNGARDKTLHVLLDDQELKLEPSECELDGTVSGSLTSFTIPAKYMTHGSHRVQIYLSTTINGRIEYSLPDSRDILAFDETEEFAKAVIGTDYDTITIKQYESISIRYTVYQPKTNAPDVTLYLNDTKIQEQTLKGTNTDHYPFMSTQAATYVFTIKCGMITKSIDIIVEKLDTPIKPVAGTAFDFRPLGKSNLDTNRLWEDAITGVKMSVSPNFDWVNGGYGSDKDADGKIIPGTEHFLVKAGTTATIEYELFGTDIKNSGKEVKLIFKTKNISNTQTSCISCLSDNIGFEMTPHEARIYDSIDVLKLAYSDEDIIELEFNIAKASDKVPMVIGYEDGVATRCLILSNSSKFQQRTNNRKQITIGCEDCDVCIYRFKVYEKSLTDKDILNNFIADARTPDEIIDRYNRNQIFDENDKLTPESVAKACPGLRVYKLSAPQFTKDKEESIPDTTITQLVYREDRTLDTKNSWTCTGAEHSGQGTSSNDYGKAGRNLDFKMNVAGAIIKLADGTPVDTIQLSPRSVPTNYLNLKVNIASSNNMTNAMMAKLYNEYGRKIYQRPLVRTADYPYDVKDTMEFHNCVIFIQETDKVVDANGMYVNHREFNDTDYHFYAIGNIGDSKKTDNTRLNDPSDPYECCVEIVDVGKPLSAFPVDTMYPACSSSEDETTGETIHSWLSNLSVDILFEKTDQGKYIPTNDTEIDYSAYDKYYVDMLEYDKFDKKATYDWRYCSNKKNDNITKVCKQAWREFYKFITTSPDSDFVSKFNNYMVKDSALFNYLFTLRYCMVDNRAKNTFWHFAKTGEYHVVDNPHVDLLPIYYEKIDGDYVLTTHTKINSKTTYYSQHRFDLTWDYDNDTALGLNNYGQQVYRYGLEEQDDDEYGEEIFRESDSTFYLRIKELFKSDLAALYGSNKLTTLWNSENLIALADEWQTEFPEALWRLDIERKYIRTYTEAFINQPGDAQFLTRMCNGKMKYHRRQWERNQSNYMASKFISSLSQTKITMRLKDKSQDSTVAANYTFSIKPYAYTYINVSYKNEEENIETKTPIRIEDLAQVVSVSKPADVARPDIINIYNPEAISSIGDLSTFYLETLTVSDARHLTEVILGSDKAGYVNNGFTTFDTAGNPLLSKITIENIPSLKGDLDLSELIKLSELYSKGTNLTSIQFAPGGALSYVELPSSITSLEFNTLQYLTDATIKIDTANNKFTNLTSLTIKDCSNINVDNILNRCTDKLTYLWLTNMVWHLEDKSSEEIATYFKDTYNDYESCYLEGKLYVDFIDGADYSAIKKDYPDIDIIYNTLKCRVIFKDENDIVLYTYERSKSYGDVVTCPEPVSFEKIEAPVKEASITHTYTFIGWSERKGDFVLPLVSPLSDVEGEVIVFPVFHQTVREYTITYVAGTDVLYSKDFPALNLEGETYLPEFNPSYVTKTELLTEDEDGNLVPKNTQTNNPDNYEFIGWSPNLSIITENITYKAVFAIAEYDILTAEDIEYTTSGRNLTITSIKDKDKYILKVPETFEIEGTEYLVTGINALPDNMLLKIEALDLSETNITVMPQDFLLHAPNLKELHLPPNVQKIEFRAVYDTAISFIDVPASVYKSNSIGYVAFADNKLLETVWLRCENPEQSLFSFTENFSIFTECPKLKDIYVGWSKEAGINGTVNAKGDIWNWGAPEATVHYNTNFNLIDKEY